MEIYTKSYISLYHLIKTVSDRLELNLVSELYEGIEVANLQSLRDALKNSYPSTKELFKKFPLRHLHYISPSSKATMKSFTKYLDEKKLSVSQTDDYKWYITPSASQEMIVASSMRIMAEFQRFIDDTKSCLAITSLFNKLDSNMASNKRIIEQLSGISREITAISKRRVSPESKIEDILYILKKQPNKQELVTVLLSLLKEWGIDVPSTHAELCEGFVDITPLIDELMNNLRIVPYDDSMKIIDKTLEGVLEVSNEYLENKLKIGQQLRQNICRFVMTIRLGLSNNLLSQTMSSNGIPSQKSIISEVKRCYRLADGMKLTKIEGTTTNPPIISELVDKYLIRKEQISVGDFNISNINNMSNVVEFKKKFYSNLEKNNILWSDEYITQFLKEAETVLSSFAEKNSK